MQCGATPIDVSFYQEGNIVLFWPHTENARNWFDENVSAEGWQWFGPRLAVDQHYAADLVNVLTQEGFHVQSD